MVAHCHHTAIAITFDRLLIGKGVEVNKVAKSGGTAIMFSAGGGHNDTTKLLLEHGADVNVVVAATPGCI